MNNYIEYRGYRGTIEYTHEDDILFGKVIGIRGLLSYEGESIAAVKKDFMETVDDYMEMCEINNIKPEKPIYETEEVLQVA